MPLNLIKIKGVLSFLAIISYGLADSTDSFLPPCTLNITRVCDESLNSYGPSQCQTQSDCFEGRVCSPSGYCTYPCKSDIDCIEGTYCSNLGSCEGVVEIASQLSIQSESQTQSEEQSQEGSENGERVACTSHTTSICDESLNSIGAFRCELSIDCSEGRYCSRYGYCQDQNTNSIEADLAESQNQSQSQNLTFSGWIPGPKKLNPWACTSHMIKDCKESLNSYGSGRCKIDLDCYGARICDNRGICQYPACTAHTSRICDERYNYYGPYRCKVDSDCNGSRECSVAWYCYDITQDPW